VKRAEKRGVVVRLAEFDDQFVHGIQGVYNDTSVRQSSAFWHYGKDFESIKAENATYLDRSDFVGAYLNDELIGFIKIVYVNDVACFMQIISKASQHDKRPTNALIAKAVEISAAKGCSYLTYGKYVYGNKTRSTLADFKRRNGFECVLLPRYYVPLTTKGRLLIAFGLHRGWKRLIPPALINALVKIRTRLREQPEPARKLEPQVDAASQPETISPGKE
jgi:hypothetical protein